MTALPKELTELLAKYGIDRKSLTRIKFGGVVGKQALVGISGVVGLIVVAFKAENLLLWGCAAGIFVLTVGTILAIGIHGHVHPIEATLEGGEVVVVQHLRSEAAAKGIGQIPPSPPVLEGIGHKAVKDAKES